MKLFMGILLMLIIIFAVGCASEQPVEQPQLTIPEEIPAPAKSNDLPPSLDTKPETPAEQPKEQKVAQPEPQVREFTMTAKQWEFSPNTITVNKGDTVKLHITSKDVTHGFNLPDFGISKQLIPTKTVDVEFVADKQGTFTFSCSVPCGKGHSGMNGKLVVE